MVLSTVLANNTEKHRKNQPFGYLRLNYKAIGSKCLDNKEENCDIYGRLYEYGTALPGCSSGRDCSNEIGLEPQGVCPDGWYLPSEKDWYALADFAGGDTDYYNNGNKYNVARTKLLATSGWKNGNGTDNFGFRALPSNGYYAKFWTSTTHSNNAAEEMEMYGTGSLLSMYTYSESKNNVSSVRCLKNSGTIPRCGNIGYDPKTHFCTKSPSKPEIFTLCGGKGYDTRTKFCKDGEVQDLPTVPSKPTFTDARDKKEYKYVKIGEQTWMAENINYAAEGSKCYNNEEANCDTYGRLYKWATATSGVCPAGWHVPSRAEWNTLADFVGGEYSDGSGNKLKAISNLWQPTTNPSLGDPAQYAGTDDYGFAALPGGQSTGTKFESIGRNANWWSTDVPDINPNNAYVASLGYNVSYFATGGSSSKTYLLSVRCLKD